MIIWYITIYFSVYARIKRPWICASCDAAVSWKPKLGTTGLTSKVPDAARLGPKSSKQIPGKQRFKKNMEETSGMIWIGQVDLHPAVCERKRSCSFHSSCRHVMAFNLFSIQLIHILHLDWDGIHGHRGWVWMGWLSEKGLRMINNSFSCTTQTLSKLASPNC